MTVADRVVTFQASVKKFQLSVLNVLVAARQLKASDTPENRQAFGRAVVSLTVAAAATGVEGVELVRSTPAGRVAADLSGVAGLVDSAENLAGKGLELQALLNDPAADQALVDAKLGEVLWAGAGVVADTASIVVPQLRLAGKAGKVLGTWAPAALGVIAAGADSIGQLTVAANVRDRIAITESAQAAVVEELEVRALVTHRLDGGAIVSWDLNPDDTSHLLRVIRNGESLVRIYLPEGTVPDYSQNIIGGYTYGLLNGDTVSVSSSGTVSVKIDGVSVVVPHGYTVNVTHDQIFVVPQVIDVDILDYENSSLSNIEYFDIDSIVYAGQFGSVFGSSIGQHLSGSNKVAGIVYSSLLGTIGERIAVAVSAGNAAELIYGQSVQGALGEFSQEVALRAGQAAIGTVSSWITLELGQALGLEGFGAELFNTAGSTVTQHIIGNLLNGTGPFASLNVGGVADGLGGGMAQLNSALGSAIGAFLGARLGALVAPPHTQAAVALSSVGSAVGAFTAGKALGAVGSWATTKLGSMLGNMIVPGIGAFVGFVLGSLIGNLFGRKKPKIPTANAEVYLDYTLDQFRLGGATAVNGGNLDLVRNMAEAARDTLNGFLTVLAGDMPYEATSWGNGIWRNGKYFSMPAGVQSFYGHTGGQLWVKLGSPNATQQNVASADDAVSKGVMWSIKQTQVIGGDIFAKRALANSAATDLTSLMGDLQIASDYRFYAENRELISHYIIGAYNTLTQGEKDYYAANKAVIDKAHTQGLAALTTSERAFYDANKVVIDKVIQALEDQAIANPWIITLQRINELKLDQWSTTDFYGGLQGFLTSIGLEGYGAHLEDVRITDLLGGMTLSIDSPTASSGVFDILPQALDAPLGNDLLNPHGHQGRAGWEMATWQTSTAQSGVNLNADWSGSGNDVFWSYMGGVPTVGAVVDVRSEFIESEAGVTYEASVLAAQHRGEAGLFIQFYDANKVAIGATFMQGTARESGGWHGDASTFNTISGQAVAPPGTAFRRIGLRLAATGDAEPYAFFTQPMTRQVGGPAIDWSQNGNAIRVNDLAKIGYTRTNGNTAGNDYVDFSGAQGGVSWSDYSTETHTEIVYDPYGYGWWEEEVTTTITGGDDIVVGGWGGDFLAGLDGWDWIDGGDGNDTIEGGNGDDVLLGGDGRDQLNGGAGDDYLVSGLGDDHPFNGTPGGMFGGAGNDTLVFNGGIDAGFGEDGDDLFLMEQDGYNPVGEFTATPPYDYAAMDYVDGGVGSDTVSFERYTTPVTRTLDPQYLPWINNPNAMPAGGINGVVVALWNHPASWTDPYWADVRYVMGDWLKSIENVTGSKFNDYISGDAGNNILKGGDGDDFLDGNLGHDTLEGGAGADFMFAAGEGTLSYRGSNAGVFIDMTTGEAFGGHATGDRWQDMDHLIGSRFADELKGDAGSNRITALAGDDWIVATKGGDIYDGGEGIDTVDYSSGFATGVSTYQQWVDDGYWEYDDRTGQSVWVEMGGHYETVTGEVMGLHIYMGGNFNKWRAVDGTLGSHELIGIEHIVGTTGADYIALAEGNEFVTGGKGNDYLSGSSGADTYYFNLGDGADTVAETNQDANVISFGSGIGFNQLTFAVAGGSTGYLQIFYSGTDSVKVSGNFATAQNNRAKVLDMNGAGQLDISEFDRWAFGSSANNTISGATNYGDLLVGYGGDDVIKGSLNGAWESRGNIIIAGTGNDTVTTSGGDDQFVFERGSGRDTVTDSGGEDTLVFGPNVAAKDVIYKVVGQDLYIGIADASNPTLAADQVADYVRIVGGGIRYYYIDMPGAYSFNTIEFINAGGTWIDLRKLDLNWTAAPLWTGGGPPIVFDLEGDGLDLTGVDDSMIVSRLESGALARTSWVGPTDGMLVYDRNGDGQIDRLSEISFVQDKPGAKTDLEGLRAWDTNGDNKLNSLDEGWAKLQVWVDRNQNGRSTEGELRSLEEAGIVEINLVGTATGNSSATTRDSFVHNTLSFTWADGRTGTAYDVELARKLLNELKLTEEEIRAAWAGGGDSEFGRLLNDPVADAVAALSRSTTSATRHFGKQLEDLVTEITERSVASGSKRSPTLAEVLSYAQVDFSNHDRSYALDLQRWAAKLRGERVKGLADEGVGGGTDAHVRASLAEFAGGLGRGGYGARLQRPDWSRDSIDVPPVDATGAATADADEIEGLGRVAPRRTHDLGDAAYVRPSTATATDKRLDTAALLLASGDDTDHWAPAEFGLASANGRRSWWLGGVDGSAAPEAYSIAMSPVLDRVVDGTPLLSAEEQSQHQKLTQALAAFGRDKGASPAVWRRSGEVEDQPLTTVASGRWRFATPARIPA